jgi:hypothetical protein
MFSLFINAARCGALQTWTAVADLSSRRTNRGGGKTASLLFGDAGLTDESFG